MPRTKPTEILYPVTYRLTRTQIRKVQEMGGVAWLRQMISKTEKTKYGRSAVEYAREIRKRNDAIAADPRPTKELIPIYRLSKQQINAIRRQYAIDKEIDYEADRRNNLRGTAEQTRQLGFTRPW